MLHRIQEAAISPWWIVTAGFIGWAMWAARRYATRQPKELPMKVTDPVCGMTLDADQAAAQVEHEGKTYHFCSEACHKRFVAEAGKYVATAPQGPSVHH